MILCVYLVNLLLPTRLNVASECDLKGLAVNSLKSPISNEYCFVYRNSFNSFIIKNDNPELIHTLEDYVERAKYKPIDEMNGANLLSHYALKKHESSITSNGHKILFRESAMANSYFIPKTKTEFRNTSSNHYMCQYLAQKSNQRIMQAKNELLVLIEEFKQGISIDCFEQIFSDWESKFKDVLEGQMSHELQYSLNQIKKLCSLNDQIMEENDEEEYE